LSRDRVTIDGVWIGNWIYCILTTCNYNYVYNTTLITVTHTSLLSMLQPPLVVAQLQSPNKGYFWHPCSLRTALTNRRLETVLYIQSSKLPLASSAQSFLVLGPVGTHDHIFVFSERRGLTTTHSPLYWGVSLLALSLTRLITHKSAELSR
jgi:hypothetical protein